MRRLTLTAASAAGLSAAVLAACAPTPAGNGAAATPESAARACFVTNQVNNFRAGENQNLYLRAGRAGVFELSTIGWCQDLDWANALTITPQFGGTRLCPGDQAVIGYRAGGATPNGPCRARVVRKLTNAEVEALPGRSRP